MAPSNKRNERENKMILKSVLQFTDPDLGEKSEITFSKLFLQLDHAKAVNLFHTMCSCRV